MRPNRSRGDGSAWLAAHGFGLLLGLAAAIPVAVATAHALEISWFPSADDGVLVLRAFDVLSSHPPLVGQYTQGSFLIGERLYSPGPMLYWLLAFPAHLGPDAIVLTMGAVNAGSVVGIVLLAQRRGGSALAVATAVAVVLMCRTLPVEVPYEVWNPWATLFPLTLLLFVAWSVACGDHKLLPLLVVVASYVVQGHLTYAPAVLSALVVAVGGLALLRRRGQGAPMRAWAIGALVVGLVCWSWPIADQVRHRPGNLVLLTRFATDDHRTLGTARGLRATAHTIVGMPGWALHGRSRLSRLAETIEASTITYVGAVLVLAALLWLLAAAWRRRSHEVLAALVLALLLCLSTFVVASSIPRGALGLSVTGYALVWTSPVSMWLWLALGWSAWSLYGPSWSPVVRSTYAVRVAALAGTGALAVAVAISRDYDDPTRLPGGLLNYVDIQRAVARVTDAVDDSRGVFIDVSSKSIGCHTFRSAIAYALRREGVTISVPPNLGREVGTRYAARPGGYEHVLQIRDTGTPVAPGSRTVFQTPEVTVSVARP